MKLLEAMGPALLALVLLLCVTIGFIGLIQLIKWAGFYIGAPIAAFILITGFCYVVDDGW